jgi:hypothetical protein
MVPSAANLVSGGRERVALEAIGLLSVLTRLLLAFQQLAQIALRLLELRDALTLRFPYAVIAQRAKNPSHAIGIACGAAAPSTHRDRRWSVVPRANPKLSANDIRAGRGQHVVECASVRICDEHLERLAEQMRRIDMEQLTRSAIGLNDRALVAGD